MCSTDTYIVNEYSGAVDPSLEKEFSASNIDFICNVGTGMSTKKGNMKRGYNHYIGEKGIYIRLSLTLAYIFAK